MRTDTFQHLEGLCQGKGIVCEKRGRKIELTTPNGGTTAECESLAEAFDTYRTDPTFSELPLRLNIKPNEDEKPKTREAREALEFKREIADSDKRIAEALALLNSHPRGQAVLTLLKAMMKPHACGLDQQGWYAVQTLVNETAAGRRDYLDRIA